MHSVTKLCVIREEQLHLMMLKEDMSSFVDPYSVADDFLCR